MKQQRKVSRETQCRIDHVYRRHARV